MYEIDFSQIEYCHSDYLKSIFHNWNCMCLHKEIKLLTTAKQLSKNKSVIPSHVCQKTDRRSMENMNSVAMKHVPAQSSSYLY